MPGSTVCLSGSDTLNFGGRTITNVADGDYAELTYPEELSKFKVGKNGNTIIALNAQGQIADFKLRLIRGSPDDQYLNSIVQDYFLDPAGFLLVDAQLVKRNGDGQQNISHDTYAIGNGAPTRFPGGKSNAEGDTDQSVAIYEFKFSNASDRAIL